MHIIQTERKCKDVLSCICTSDRILILSVLQKEDSYGYEISRTVKLVADIKSPRFYPILKKLEKNGFMTTYTKEYQGRKRKYYSLTDAGVEELKFLNSEWISYRDTIDGIVEGRIKNDER